MRERCAYGGAEQGAEIVPDGDAHRAACRAHPAGLFLARGGGEPALSRRLRCRLRQTGRARRGRPGAPGGQSQNPRADGRGLRHHRGPQSGRQAFPWRRHPQPPVAPLRGQPGLFRLRADRRPQRPHQRPRRLVLRGEHVGRNGGHREERWLVFRRRHPRRRPDMQGRCRRPHRHRDERRHHHRGRAHGRVLGFHDAARPTRRARRCRPKSWRLDV